ncbi:MAG: YncE family protein [Acidobacteriaceae bacterium]
MKHPRLTVSTVRFGFWQRLAVSFGLVGVAFAVTISTTHAETDPAQGRLISSQAIAANPVSEKVYAVNGPANSVAVFDERHGSMHSVNVGKGPVSLAIDPRTNRIYVVNAGADSVSVIDGRDDAVIATIREKPGSDPYVLTVDDAANKIYVTNTYSSALMVIDGATNVAHTLKTGSADGIALDPRIGTVFLMTYEDPDIRLVNPRTGAIVRVRVGPHLWGMTFDQSLHTLYVAHTVTNNIVALNETTHAVHTIPTGSIPCAVAIDPATQRLYAVNYGSQTLSVIDARTGRVLATLPVGSNPQAVVVDSPHNRIYVANVHGNSVTIIDGARNTVLGVRPAGTNPYALALGTGMVFAVDYGKPSIVPVAPLAGAAGAEQALKDALEANRFVALYRTGRMRLPQAKPEMYLPGSEEEAALCLENLRAAWDARRNAVF